MTNPAIVVSICGVAIQFVVLLVSVITIIVKTGQAQTSIKAEVSKIESINKINHDTIMERISRLETKQDKHNQLIERMVAVERDLKTAFRMIEDLQGKEE